VSNSGGDGVELLSNDNMVVSTKSNGNGGDGYDLSDDIENQITSSQANSNGGAGARLLCPATVLLLNARAIRAEIW
ncbi:MAG TPA: hypothetical protein VMT58_08420, partial [Candidatus Binataceae bacterium]|nr:hypothetical protein [Candidatus Binataceae bacterium]